MARRGPTQRDLDAWFPTLVRYAGIVLATVLAVEFVLGHLQYPSLSVLAGGMILYKTVRGSNGHKNGNGDPESP